MTRAEEAGQPARHVSAQPGTDSHKPQQHDPEIQHDSGWPGAALARPAWSAVSEEAVEALEKEIGKEDLADPCDPAELARVESARRRLADLVLMEELAASGFRGVAFDMFVTELAAYGIAALMAWMRTGQIARQCSTQGRPLADSLPERWSRDDRLEIAVETTARALKHFIGEMLIPQRWDPSRGASLKTFFVGSCVLQFPNVYDVWRTEQRAWCTVEVIEPGTEDTAAPVSHGRCWSDPTAEDVIRRLLTKETLGAIKDSRTRTAAEMVMHGHRFAEAGEAVGLSAAAVEGRLYRLRRRPR
jgi:hypothetical protein